MCPLILVGEGVVEVGERCGAGEIYGIYFLQHLPRFGGVVEVKVDPSNFNWRRCGTGGGEVW